MIISLNLSTHSKSISYEKFTENRKKKTQSDPRSRACSGVSMQLLLLHQPCKTVECLQPVLPDGDIPGVEPGNNPKCDYTLPL